MIGLRADSENRYRIFVDTVLETKTVWGLRSADGWAVAPSNEFEDVDVMPFWSHRASAKAVAREEWADYEPSELDLESFVAKWLRGMHEQGYRVGTNWNTSLVGLELEPIELARTLLDTDSAEGE